MKRYYIAIRREHYRKDLLEIFYRLEDTETKEAVYFKTRIPGKNNKWVGIDRIFRRCWPNKNWIFLMTLNSEEKAFMARDFKWREISEKKMIGYLRSGHPTEERSAYYKFFGYDILKEDD